MSIINLAELNDFKDLGINELREFIIRAEQFKGTIFESFTNRCVYPVLESVYDDFDQNTAVSFLETLGFEEYKVKLEQLVKDYVKLLPAQTDPKEKVELCLVYYFAAQLIGNVDLINSSYDLFNKALKNSCRHQP